MYNMINNIFVVLLVCNIMVDGGVLPDDDINKDIEKELKEHMHDFGEQEYFLQRKWFT